MNEQAPNADNDATAPFFDESYTFGDRARELVLMETLLVDKITNVRMERALLQHIMTQKRDSELPTDSDSPSLVDDDPTLPQPGDE